MEIVQTTPIKGLATTNSVKAKQATAINLSTKTEMASATTAQAEPAAKGNAAEKVHRKVIAAVKDQEMVAGCSTMVTDPVR